MIDFFVHGLAQRKAVSMGYMIFPGAVRCPEFFHRQFSGRHQLCHPDKFPLRIALILVPKFPYRCAICGDVGAESQVADTVLEWEYLSLTVQRQFQRFQIRRYDLKAPF